VQSTDTVELSSPSVLPPQIIKPTAKINKLEAAERATNDLLVHLACSDTPAMLSIWANLGTLPSALTGVLGVFNVFNTATGVVSIALDSRETLGTFRNPKATKLDKIVDLVHLVGGDMVSTAASMVPLVASLASPLSMGIFVGGQLLGLGLDVAKTIYDAKRKGQQSAR
jgi:hypothetical protein